MPTVPSSLALSNIADGAEIIASTHRNNYSAIQAAVNGLRDVLGDVSTKGDILVATSDDVLARLPVASSNYQALMSDAAASSGLAYKRAPQVYDAVLTSTDVFNTVTETSFYSKSIAANDLTSRILRVTVKGDYLNNSGASRTITFKIKLGTTVLFTDVTAAFVADANRRPWIFETTIVGLTSASQSVNGYWFVAPPGAATTGTGDHATAADTYVHAGTATEDLTSAKTLDLLVTHPAAHASLSFRTLFATAELL